MQLSRIALAVTAFACGGGQSPPMPDAPEPVDASPPDAAGPPTQLTVTITGSNAAFINITSKPFAIDCGSGGTTCTAELPLGSQVTLIGKNQMCFESGWRWSQCAPASGSACEFTLGGPLQVTVSCASAVTH